MSSKEHVVAVIITAAILGPLFYWLYLSVETCRSRGGVPVRGACLKRSAVIDP